MYIHSDNLSMGVNQEFCIDYIIENDSFSAPYGSINSCEYRGSDYVVIEAIELVREGKPSKNIDLNKLPKKHMDDIIKLVEKEAL